MNGIIKPDWNNFRAKFSNAEESAFEHFCYLLFCKEFGKNSGISRFHNQAGVETNPIEKGGELVGWQAKFYATKLSDHKQDFIESIDTAQARHPGINKL